MGLIAVFAIVALVGVFYTTRVVTSASRDAADAADTALLGAQASERLGFLLEILQGRVDTFLASPTIAALSREQAAELNSQLSQLNVGPISPDFASYTVELSLSEAAEFQATIEYLRSRMTIILARVGNPTFQASAGAATLGVDAALNAYFQEPTLGHLREMQVSLQGVMALTSAGVPGSVAEADALRDKLQSSVDFLRTAMVLFAVIATLTFFLFGRHMSSSIQGTIDGSAQEKAELEVTTEALRYRNSQLNALYNVFSEITSTLSLKYVVEATLRESMQLMRADMAVLRILRSGELVVEGAMTSAGQMLTNMRPVELGIGPTGRTAKLGRTMRIDRDGENMMGGTVTRTLGGSPAEQSNRPKMESGMIVPLVVGARVVGTLSCWTTTQDAFSEEDERILEMMASQVATAIVAADTTDMSLSRAQHDALTGLPNRRQLDEDVAGRLTELAHSGRQAVVAMVDIDHFKRLNDDYGHRVGDVTLQRVAAVLRGAVREKDFVYRYGGEEFVLVFSDTPPEEALAMANRLREAVETSPMSGERLEPVGPVTISIGLALVPDHGTDIVGLIEMADKAMYRAKQNGRNRVELWEGSGAGNDLSSVA